MKKFYDLKFSGNNEWSEASIAPLHGYIIDDVMMNDNLNLLILSQYMKEILKSLVKYNVIFFFIFYLIN